MAVKQSIKYDEYTTEELLSMKKNVATNGLNENHQRFCEAYVTTYNVKTALVKAGYEQGSSAQGYLIRKRPAAQLYIQWLKARIMQETFVRGKDLIDEWIRISFADMSDFVDILPNSIRLKPSNQIDGQLIKSIKSGRDGISIELYDKLKAMDALARYTEDMPKDYRQMLEERRASLMEQEFELKKRMYDLENKEGEDDGFLEALSESANSVWEEE